MIFTRKHFLDIQSLTDEEIYYILNSAQKMKYTLTAFKVAKVAPHLKGKTVAMLFHQESSRTKLSYELAAQNLSAKVIHLTTTETYARGESLKDIGRYVDQMGADFIVIRHPIAGGPHHLSKYVKASVINGGDGMNENPSQSLIDLLTIMEYKKDFKGLNVVLIGDIKHNRVAKSNIWALTKLGAKVRVVGPPTLIPFEIQQLGAKVYYDLSEAIVDADVVMTLKIQTDRQDRNLLPSINEYKKLYKLDVNRLAFAKPDVIVMHPGPINRGIEISSQVIDGESSLVSEQQINGVAVRMALFHVLSNRNTQTNVLGGLSGEFHTY